ncbi:hypothetical protein Taro_007369 [Colocasia esculenta]|uniref:Uncharacterized protein n=1 Tax=Colocasia esculenta TaxID=4460 RepID=A0A843U3M1_COLES|nr:hypothetical protein [Colocasia esculenta]
MEFKFRLDSLGLMEKLESTMFSASVDSTGCSCRQVLTGRRQGVRKTFSCQWLSTGDTAAVDRHSCPEVCLVGMFVSIDRDLSGCRQVVWQPYLEEGDEGQPWLVQARPYFDRSMWSAVEFPSRDRTPTPGRSFQGLHDTTDWRERAKEQIQNWEHRGKGVKSSATTDDAYLQAYALKYGGKVYKSARRQVDLAGETASLRALLHSAMQDREAAQREAEQLQRELERVRRATVADASSFGEAGSSQSDLEDRLAAAVRRAEETQADLAERETALRAATDRAIELQGQAAEARVTEVTRELATLRVQGSSADQEELTRLLVDLQAQQTLVRGLQGVITAIGRSHSRSRSGTSASKATGASVGQYMAGSSSHRRNKEEERCHQGEASAQSGRGGGEMTPPPDRHEGSRESGGEGSGKGSRGLLEWNGTGAAGPQKPSDGSGGRGGPPELRVSVADLGCRGTDRPSPKLPKVTMMVNGRRPQLGQKEKGGDRHQEGRGVTGITVKAERSAGVTGIAVKSRGIC